MKNSPETLKKRAEKRKHYKSIINLDSIDLIIIKICKICGELKDHKWTSSFTQTGKPEYRTRCNDCWNKKQQEYRSNNETYKIKRNISKRKRCREIKLKAIEYLGGCCKICGYKKCPRALTFHHISRSNKVNDIAVLKQYSWERVKQELDKCELLCFNCHMEQEEEYELIKEQELINSLLFI